MRIILLLFCLSLLISCNSNKSNKDNLLEDSSLNQLNFTAQFKGKDYNLEVNCSYLEEEYFLFKSDKLDNKDTNGDGIVVSGFQNKNKLAFTIIIEGEVYSTPKLDVWSKSKNNIIGSGYVYLEGTTQKINISFNLICK